MVGGYSALPQAACLSEAAECLNKYMSPTILPSNHMHPTSAPAPRKARRRTNSATKRDEWLALFWQYRRRVFGELFGGLSENVP